MNQAERARSRRRRVGTETEAGAAAFSRGSLQRAIQLPLFGALESAGGRARPIELYDRVADELEIDESTLSDTRTSANGRPHNVFQQQVRWARQTAIAEGLIVSGGRGIWELTDSGYEKLGKIRRGKVVLLYKTNYGIALWAHAEDAAAHIASEPMQSYLEGSRLRFPEYA